MPDYYIAPESSFDATADAIRAKTGSQESIEWTEDGFADAITEIPTGNDREDLTTPKDVDFIDFDGKLLYSYTAQEFLALNALPPNPSYAGLTAQGWNWDLSDAKTFVGKYGCLVVGQNYTTSNGRTRIYLSIVYNEPYALNVGVCFTPTVKNGITIYWGDETSTVGGTANTNTVVWHTYSTPGNYIIELEVTSGNISLLGGDSSGKAILIGGPSNSNVRPSRLAVQKIEIGDNVLGFARNVSGFMLNCQSMSIPTTLTSIVDYDETAFTESLKAVVFPKNFTTNRYRGMFGSYISAKYISVPKGMHNLHINTFPRQLRKLTIDSLEPYSGTSETIKLYDAYPVTHLVVMGTYSEVQTDAFRNMAVKKLFIPASVTKINTTSFAYNYLCEEIHLYPTVPPTLGNSNAFNGTTGTFYVPYSADHSILEAYQTATNWSTYASRMQEEPQS